MARRTWGPYILPLLVAAVGTACTTILGDFSVDDPGSSGGGGVTSASGGGQGAGSGGQGGSSTSGTGGGGSGGSGDCTSPCDCDCDAQCDAGPVNLAPGPQDARGIALSATHVFWTDFDSGYVMKVPKSGGEPEVLAMNQPSPQYLTVRGDHVYWTLSGAINRASTAGGVVEPIASSQGTATGITSDADGIYWTNQTATIRGYPLPNGPVMTITENGGLGPYGIATDGTYAYWADRAADAIRRAPLAGGPVETLTALQSTEDPRSIAVRGGFVYWTEHVMNGRVLRIDARGGASQMPEVLATGVSPFELAVDDTHVYWSDVGDSTVNKVPIDDPSSTVLEDMDPSPGGIALSEHCVYWVEENGFVRALRK